MFYCQLDYYATNSNYFESWDPAWSFMNQHMYFHQIISKCRVSSIYRDFSFSVRTCEFNKYGIECIMLIVVWNISKLFILVFNLWFTVGDWRKAVIIFWYRHKPCPQQWHKRHRDGIIERTEMVKKSMFLLNLFTIWHFFYWRPPLWPSPPRPNLNIANE